jgi:hypothetical protein
MMQSTSIWRYLKQAKLYSLPCANWRIELPDSYITVTADINYKGLKPCMSD